jgi:hypothetical protein
MTEADTSDHAIIAENDRTPLTAETDHVLLSDASLNVTPFGPSLAMINSVVPEVYSLWFEDKGFTTEENSYINARIQITHRKQCTKERAESSRNV